ncbi:MAG TPA: sigma-70 family RNA polymerase sigma factor [Streptosporangiaceae bacterium]|nr:sigma-70 family RNA polymerase sigma factor [Streptosporangiaceae bacterium]
MTANLIERARAGDGEAFGQLIEPHQRELMVHCYRMLGSAQDAEDALQETMLAAWRGFAGFEGRSSVRTWLYRVATSRCLNALRSASRRPPAVSEPPRGDPPEPTRLGAVVWLEPLPDTALDGLADRAPGPDARYEASEAISLAFVTALQLLPPRQRAVLILRDVLGYPARDVAGLLDATEESVASALKRARATIRQRLATAAGQPPAPAPGSAEEQDLVTRFTRAFESGDVAGIVALMTEDAWLRMPPLPLEYQGREPVRRFFAAVWQGRSYRLVPARANGQPAFGVYGRDPQAGVARANGLLVATLAGHQMSALTRFETGVMARFGLPRMLPG